jgi:Tol biopolymer transport system component
VTPAVIPPNVLPPTWTPSPPPTLLPSPTWTAAPPGLNTYTLVFSGNRVPGDPFELFVVQADGSGLRPLLLTLPPLETPEVQPAAAQESTEEAAPAEAEETAPPPETGTPTVQLLDPAFSPDGRSIAFTGQVGDIQELYVVGYPNGTPRQLTRLGAKRTVGASWAPDGDSILVASNADGDFDIYQVDSRGDAPLKNLTNNEGFDDVDPSWSPDGKYIAFASDRLGKGALEIFVMPLEGSDVCQMTESTNSSFAPNWSHDGQAILFISNRNTDNDLFIMRSDGSDERLLSLNDKDWEEREPTWSPDQRWIVLSSNWEDSPTTTLWLASPDGAEWKRVVNGEGEGRDASWLPGGETVSLPPDFQFRCAR